MFLLNKLLQFLTPLSLLIIFEILIYKEKWLWIISPIVVVLVILTLWSFNRRKINIEFFSFLISPFIYVTSCIAFVLFVEENLFYHAFAVAASIFLFIYLGRILDYKFYPKRYQPYSLENFSWYLNLIISFVFFSFIYALIIFIKVKMIYLVVPVLAVSMLLAYQLFWVNKIKFRESNVFVFTIAVVLVELFSAIYYLPTSFFINALILTVAFYLMTGLSRYFLLGNLNRKKIINFIIVSAVCLVAILATAQWV